MIFTIFFRFLQIIYNLWYSKLSSKRRKVLKGASSALHYLNLFPLLSLISRFYLEGMNSSIGVSYKNLRFSWEYIIMFIVSSNHKAVCTCTLLILALLFLAEYYNTSRMFTCWVKCSKLLISLIIDFKIF